MKHIALAGWFAATLAAQQPNAAELELAKILAVEEQERDLTRARALYEQALSGDELSAAARRLATQRLEALRERLAPGGGQDPQGSERQQELRAQARALLKGYESWRAGPRNPGDGVPREVLEQLQWIGEPAVPEVVALLQLEAGKPYCGKAGEFTSLWEFLWRAGGPVAEQFFVDCASHALLADVAATTAYSMKVVDVGSPSVRAYLDHQQPAVTERFLVTRGQHDVPLIERLRSDQLVDIAERGSPTVRALVLRRSVGRPFAKDELARMHALVRAGVAGTDPDVGKAAEEFLVGTASQQSLEGLLLVLERLPELRRRGVVVHTWSGGTPLRGPFDAMSMDDVERLARAVDACVRRIGKVDVTELRGPDWIDRLMYELFTRRSEVARDNFLAWWDLGYDMVRHMKDAKVVTADNAAEFVQRYDRTTSRDRYVLFFSLLGFDLPASSTDTLIRIAAENPGQENVVGLLVAQTGSLDALSWIVEKWRAVKPEELVADRPVRGPGNRGGDPRANQKFSWQVTAMIELASRNDAEEVRAAMRDMVRGFGCPTPSGKDRTRLLLVLMSMGDATALEYVAANPAMQDSVHPLDEESRSYTPMQYLVDSAARPKHPYSQQQVLETVRAYEQEFGERALLDASAFPVANMADEVMVALARGEGVRGRGPSWQHVAVRRLDGRLAQGGDVSVLEPWFLSVIGKDGLDGRCADDLPRGVLQRYRSQLTAAMDGESAHWANKVFRALWSLDQRVDAAALLKNRHEGVRQDVMELVRDGEAEVAPANVIPLLRDENENVRSTAAAHLGAKVCKEAVPELIERLRDESEEVREAASAALTRIRFYHEQQAHWDRVLKGVDASPASAAEKLLMQAKPDQQKAQRLLAIESLGVLGKPEALPFLIEFSQESDADVSKAAKAAITKIHLAAR